MKTAKTLKEPAESNLLLLETAFERLAEEFDMPSAEIEIKFHDQKIDGKDRPSHMSLEKKEQENKTFICTILAETGRQLAKKEVYKINGRIVVKDISL